jgi:hypothetical protein
LRMTKKSMPFVTLGLSLWQLFIFSI